MLSTVHDAIGPMSFLSVVWFQDEFCFPIAERIVEQFKALNWATLATDEDL